MPKKKKRISPRLIYITIIILVITFAVMGLVNFLKTSDYCIVKDIEYLGITKTSQIDAYLGLREKNIFTLDLAKIEQDILDRYPEVRRVNVRRIFPNKVQVDIELREPVARIKSQRDYVIIDNEGKRIAKYSSYPQDRLPIIVGLRFINNTVSPPEKLALALNLLKAINGYNDLAVYDINKIDVTDTKDASFFINQKLQIKIGSEDFSSRLEILLMLLKKVESQINQIKYIDLRFKEPVIAKR